MWRRIVSATIVLLLSGGWTHGDGSTKKTVQDLRAQTKNLRALEKTDLKEIAAWYDALIAKLKDPKHNLWDRAKNQSQFRASEESHPKGSLFGSSYPSYAHF